jgi:hypothetical protein
LAYRLFFSGEQILDLEKKKKMIKFTGS